MPNDNFAFDAISRNHDNAILAMKYVMVDIEADGPIPGDYSMVALGAVVVESGLSKTFYATLQPVSDKWLPEALAVAGFTRDESFQFESPQVVMNRFRSWVASCVSSRPIFISDNNGFDWQFVNWYFHHFLGENPFGYSSANLGSLYKGAARDLAQNFKHLRQTKHTHNALDDAKGNAEAFLEMIRIFDLKAVA